VVSRYYSSFSAPGTFQQAGTSGYYYSGWQVENIATTIGHDYTLTMLASDCPYGGHFGYTYLDGFAAADVGQNPVPEPASMALFAIGLAGMAAARKAKKAA
jgi:hypothetical protein